MLISDVAICRHTHFFPSSETNFDLSIEIIYIGNRYVCQNQYVDRIWFQIYLPVIWVLSFWVLLTQISILFKNDYWLKFSISFRDDGFNRTNRKPSHVVFVSFAGSLEQLINI